MIEVRDLRKTYGETIAVNGISFTAESGAILGLLGPNGAGKSTTIGCISGLLRPGGGRVRVHGHDVVDEATEARRGLGVVPQELALYPDLSARRNLAYWGGAYGLVGAELSERVDEILERIGLADRADEPVERFSGGMKRRLNFGCGLVHRPTTLLLDEPTVGVDPQSRVRLLDLVRREADAGTCVLYTTHYMEEAQELCDRVAIIDRGELLAIGTLEELRARMAERDLVRLAGRFDPQAARRAVAGLEGDDAEVLAVDDDAITVALPEASRRLPALFEALAEAGGEIRETTLTRPSLETLFIKLTGRELRE